MSDARKLGKMNSWESAQGATTDDATFLAKRRSQLSNKACRLARPCFECLRSCGGSFFFFFASTHVGAFSFKVLLAWPCSIVMWLVPFSMGQSL
jgi:hypothetical protein